LVAPDKKIHSDCILSLEDVSSKHDWKRTKQRTIVLTGATGFVGPFVLQQFLKRGFRVVCLVRGESDVRARERVLKTLEKYEINIKNLENLRVLRFVLSKENLGLDGNVYKDLISNITDVHHLAARINFSDPYGTLRETNVLGVVNMIKLAVVAQNTQRQSVRFHYYSTTDVLPFRTDASVEKLPMPELLRIPRGGYPQSKYVGERLITRIHTQGLQCT
jgi:thioester reductase-like protein